MRKPEGCKTPTNDRETYKLTVSDIKYMEKQIIKIWNMISYYSNMPENKTGELETVNTERLMFLIRQIEDVETALNDVSCVG
jgi:hypothetical protein